MTLFQQCEPTRDEVIAFLERDIDHYLAHLGAVLFEPIEAIHGLRHGDALAALGLIVVPEVNIPDALPTVLLAASDEDALTALLRSVDWPQQATWVAHTALLRGLLEQRLAMPRTSGNGLVYFGRTTPVPLPKLPARELGTDDMELDLSPCNLGTIALSFWMLRGWRVFGLVEGQRLLGHAVAAYPIADTEEVSAVFTAPEARQRGVASACCAVAIADICARGKRAVYVSRKRNRASIRVAEGLGMQRLFETWEFEVR